VLLRSSKTGQHQQRYGILLAVEEATAQTLRTADGSTLCFADWGPADGYPVLFLHGSPGCRLNLNKAELVPPLGGRLVTYDRPGYGRSDRKRGRTAVDCVADVEALADALGLEEFAALGGSAGAPHVLAVGARLASRVSRIGCFAPFAPLEALGWDEWSKYQDEETRAYLLTCLQGEEPAAAFLSGIDAEKRARVSPEDPWGAIVLERTRNGVWGWVDDELAVINSWGFDPSEVSVPTAIWSNPRDTVTPLNHAEWLVGAIPAAVLVSSKNAPGHVKLYDLDAAWTEVYSWLLGADLAPEESRLRWLLIDGARRIRLPGRGWRRGGAMPR
jgi:pimeloyl-ACP methyl ester carboxylesterase